MAAVTMHHFSGLAAPFVRSKGTVSGGVFILREGHFLRKSPSSFQNLRTFLFSLWDERYFLLFSFAKASLFTPGRTRGFVKPKGSKKRPATLISSVAGLRLLND